MKKTLAIVLAVMLLLSLVSCGSKGSAGDIKTGFFTLNYDSGVWTNIEDDLADSEEYCAAKLQVPDPDDSDYYLIDAKIEVSVEEPYDFREELVNYGFSQYEYKVNNTYETVKIGGIDLLKYADDEEVVYMNRIEGAGVTVSIKFDAKDVTDSRIDGLLGGLTFTLEDVGNVDGPWEWEGEPFKTEDHSVSAGGFTISSKLVPFEEYISTFETFDHSVAAVGDKVYVLTDGELRVCHQDNAGLAFVEKIELPDDDYDTVNATSDGSLWLCGSMNDVIRIKDGKVVNTYEDIDNIAMHPTGTWGVDYFTSNECNIVAFNGATVNKTPVTFKEAGTIMNLNVDENNVYVCASAADESGHKVFVYNKEGTLLKTLAGADGEALGSITFITQTANGYIGFDGNMRDVVLWNNDGAFVAEISDGDLFGTNYPWFCSSTVLPDGGILTVMTEDRADKSATELIAFVVKGF
ncbi:MAG: hypothetical protein IJ408_06500 [Clostridia bacterium]|nr:hypothetical protein [Clostridia bacterium]